MSSWRIIVGLMRGVWESSLVLLPLLGEEVAGGGGEDCEKAAQFVNLTVVGGLLPQGAQAKVTLPVTTGNDPGDPTQDSHGIQHKSPTNTSLNCGCLERETSGPKSLLQNAV